MCGSMAKPVVLKLYRLDDIRRIILRTPDYSTLEAMVCESYQLQSGSFFIKYFDDEQELITLANSSDLEIALSLMEETNLTFKFYIYMKDDYNMSELFNTLSISTYACNAKKELLTQPAIQQNTIDNNNQPNTHQLAPQANCAPQNVNQTEIPSWASSGYKFHPERLPDRLIQRVPSPVPPGVNPYFPTMFC